MKIRTILLLGLGLVIAGVASLPLLMQRSIQSRIGPQHVFALTERPESLTEDLAIAKARETLSLDGLNPDLWLLATNGRTITSNRAVITFFTHGPAATRFVYVELDGSRLVCQISVTK